MAGLGVALSLQMRDGRRTNTASARHLRGDHVPHPGVSVCYEFFKRARAKKHTQATARASIYALGIAILASILVLAIDKFSGGSVKEFAASDVLWRGRRPACLRDFVAHSEPCVAVYA